MESGNLLSSLCSREFILWDEPLLRNSNFHLAQIEFLSSLNGEGKGGFVIKLYTGVFVTNCKCEFTTG